MKPPQTCGRGQFCSLQCALVLRLHVVLAYIPCRAIDAFELLLEIERKPKINVVQGIPADGVLRTSS